ncbi:hypothetical protein CROQUDRAFT_131077 [Cronartium quercuum f. sp. fusiforme G11]|uniref:Uncharacterized protein n=1 Tax=Cronartium quercuum f. sp. fusiforme G11 TaxID=708437 RepID=A0A9P6TES5_9BASI|nr:hypothetical protein CROQUDRAFT_131077 [Cronartium quercuum f. sp. fusiforme G11]
MSTIKFRAISGRCSCKVANKSHVLVNMNPSDEWETWKKSQEVLEAVWAVIFWAHTCMWRIWHSDVLPPPSRTSRYSSESLEETSNSDVAWKEVVVRICSSMGKNGKLSFSLFKTA